MKVAVYLVDLFLRFSLQFQYSKLAVEIQQSDSSF